MESFLVKRERITDNKEEQLVEKRSRVQESPKRFFALNVNKLMKKGQNKQDKEQLKVLKRTR